MISIMLLYGALACAGPAGEQSATQADLKAYNDLKAATARTPEAQVKLALWCEAHGLAAERTKHLALATLLDPANTAARGLMGLVSYQGKWRTPTDIARQVQDDPARKALIQDYLERRARTADRPDDQWKLAMWCEDHGLKEQAAAHLCQVLKRDPGRDAAWKRLGFKKVEGRWVKPEILAREKAEAEAQSRANKTWKPKLEHLRKQLDSRDKTKRVEAEEALGRITDPRAVPSIWNVFARSDEAGQRLAVQLLARIDAPGSSQALAMLGLFSPSPTVRKNSGEILRGRDPRDFAGLLVAMIRDPVKYKVKPVGGPGSRGALTIEGKQADTQRFYSPPPAPTYIPAINDTVVPDAFGRPVVIHPFGSYLRLEGQGVIGRLQGQATAIDLLSNLVAQQGTGRAGAQLGARLSAMRDSAAANLAVAVPQFTIRRLPPSASAPNGMEVLSETYQEAMPYLRIPIGQMVAAAQATAYLAQQRLAADVRSIEEYNASVSASNARALVMLQDISGKNYGSDRESWEKWQTDLQGYVYVSPPAPVDKPTYVEEAPIPVVPQPGVSIGAELGPIVTTTITQALGPAGGGRHAFCFGAGTLVWTLEGTRPIEQLNQGDQVLSRDTETGRLSFQPVVTAYHNPPNGTYRIGLGTETVVVTGIHRLWKAGTGWVMARELKPGDRLRTIRGVATVTSVEPGAVQPVFNLALANGDNFLVGSLGVLAHDNSIVDPVEKPFDRVPELAASDGAPSAP